MEMIILPILIAATVAMAALGLTKIVTGAGRFEKRKLAERLSTDRPFDAPLSGMAAKSITIKDEAEDLPPFLAKFSFIRNLNRALIQAWPDRKLTNFLAIAGGIGLSLFLIVFLISSSMMVPLVAAAAGVYAPFFVLQSKRTKRQRILGDQLPEGLDFLARILQAGHSFSTGLQMMGEELPKPLAGEFRRAYDQHSLGQSVEDALKDMARRIDSTDFAFFITAVMINRQTGGDLSEVLKNISAMIRQRMRLAQQVKAKTAEGRFTGYIMVAFPLIMFVIAHQMNPDYANTLLNTSSGRTMLGVAAALQIMGLFAIKKITTVKV